MASTYSNLLFHVVFSTKMRIPILAEEHRSALFAYIGGILRELDGVLLEAGGVDDHVHLLVRIKPRHALADVVRTIKASSSKWLRLEKGLESFAWQVGYSAFTVSQSKVEVVQRYLRSQPEHHRRKNFREELETLLEAHGVQYEAQYLD